MSKAAFHYLSDPIVIGLGSGTTLQVFIKTLAEYDKNLIEGAVSSSNNTTQLLKFYNIPILDLNAVSDLPIYIDSCDAFDNSFNLIKGGGGALVREKILAHSSTKFICLATREKKVNLLGQFPVAVEVIPMARGLVAREIVKLGGYPIYRDNFITDNGNIILDVHNLELTSPLEFEKIINDIPGVVDNGIFSRRRPNIILSNTLDNKIETLTLK